MVVSWSELYTDHPLLDIPDNPDALWRLYEKVIKPVQKFSYKMFLPLFYWIWKFITLYILYFRYGLATWNLTGIFYLTNEMKCYIFYSFLSDIRIRSEERCGYSSPFRRDYDLLPSMEDVRSL